MKDSFEEDLQALYEQLLKLAGKEEQAIIADNLGELEACMRRKEEIVRKLRAVEGKNGQDGPPEHGEKLARLLEQVAARHERTIERIKAMLGECQDAILATRASQRAHRAYYRTRRKGREGTLRAPGIELPV